MIATITMSQLEMAVRSFEAMFDKIEHTTMYAEDVVVLHSGGCKTDGNCAPAYYATEALAVRAWFEAAMAYKDMQRAGSNIGNMLVWRIKPSLEYYDLKFVRYGGPAGFGQAGQVHEAWERTCDNDPEETVRLWRVRSRLAIRSFVRPEAEANPRRDAFEKLCADVLNSGAPAQPGTPETDADPRNPNLVAVPVDPPAGVPAQVHTVRFESAKTDFFKITKDIVGGG